MELYIRQQIKVSDEMERSWKDEGEGGHKQRERMVRCKTCQVVWSVDDDVHTTAVGGA